MTGANEPGKAGGKGHPLPASAEAREDEIPEHLIREKGHGDDEEPPSEPSAERIAPDGTPYGAGPEPR